MGPWAVVLLAASALSGTGGGGDSLLQGWKYCCSRCHWDTIHRKEVRCRWVPIPSQMPGSWEGLPKLQAMVGSFSGSGGDVCRHMMVDHICFSLLPPTLIQHTEEVSAPVEIGPYRKFRLTVTHSRHMGVFQDCVWSHMNDTTIFNKR